MNVLTEKVTNNKNNNNKEWYKLKHYNNDKDDPYISEISRTYFS